MAKKLRPAALLPELTTNKKYLKKRKFLARRKELAAAAERRGKKSGKKGKKQEKKGGGAVVRGDKKKSATSGAKKSPAVQAKKKKPVVQSGAKKSLKKGPKEGGATTRKENRQEAPPLSREEMHRLMIGRAIRGEDGTHDASLTTVGGGAVEGDGLLQYPSLPFLEDYAEQKSSEFVSPDTLLQNAHVFFKSLKKKESAMRRVAAKHLQKMKDINRRGGDKDGFRYVVPRNVKEVVQQMAQNAGGLDAAGVEAAQLTSTFGGDDKTTCERPMRRRKRKKSCFSDFYQFQVSKRWTRNAENFLNKGRAHRSMFEASKPQRSIKKF